MSKASCVVLLSGGLDSVLAARVLLEQGIEVTGVNFSGAYCPAPFGQKSRAEKAAEQLGIQFVKLPIDEGFIELVKAPRYGRGKNMNPCIDCHILMVKRAWEILGQGRSQISDTRYQIPDIRDQKSDVEFGAVSREPLAAIDFIATGEVLGQRPMSQNKQSLGVVARRSGTEGRLLRPLSARLLEPTVPEKEGLVDREKLLDIRGRSRQRQIELARAYGITEFSPPAGGCLLTDAIFSRRLKEALAHKEDTVEAIELLHLGRHFRLESGNKVIVGRNEPENEELLARAPKSATVIDGRNLPGPVALLLRADRSDQSDMSDDRTLAARLCARYSDRREDAAVTVLVAGREASVKPLSAEESAELVVQ